MKVNLLAVHFLSSSLSSQTLSNTLHRRVMKTLHKKLKLQQTSSSDAQLPISIGSHILLGQAHMPSTASCKKRHSSITSRQQHDCFS